MYCKKCKYHGFDHVSACPKCGVSWEEARKNLFLNWMTVNKHPWTYAAPDTSDAPRPPAVSDVFQPKETADISLNTNPSDDKEIVDISLKTNLPPDDGDEFSGDLLLDTLAAVTRQQSAQKKTDQFPKVELTPDDALPKDSADAPADASAIPEIDFSLDIPEMVAPPASSASQQNFQAADPDKPELEIELPTLTLEPDNSPQSLTSTDPHEGLYIPSLEEILSSTNAEPDESEAHKTTDGDDILLDLNKS